MRIRLRIILFVLLAAVAVSFQNCGKVDFKNSLSDIGKQCAASSCREGEIVPEQDVFKPELKVLLVVDNSFSMTQAQEKLATGVQSLIDGLKGFASSYYVYTTTQTGDKGVMSTRSGCRKEKDGVTTELASCPTTKELGAVYTAYEKNELTPSLAVGADFKISADATEANFDNLKSKISTVITGAGTAGNDSERGICTFLRTIYEDGANKIFNPGDVTVFGIISDEEDNSTVANCFSKKETRTDCTAEDTTPITRTRTVTCTRPECISYPVLYKVDLGSRNTFTKKTVYQRKKLASNTRIIAWSERGPQTYKESYTFKYLVPQPARDGVPQDPIESNGTASRNITTACSTSSIVSCDSTQTSFASTQVGAGNTLKPGSCQVTCSTNAAPSTSNKTKTFSAESNCNSWSEATCKTNAGNPADYVAGSCVTNSCTANATPTEDRTLSSTESDSCTAGACSTATISGINPGSGYEYVSGSCAITCTAKNYAAFTKSYTIDHTTPNSADISSQSYCNRSYGGSANLSAYASTNNNNQPASNCRIDTVGAAKYSNETETYTELPPAGTPKCVTGTQKTFGFPSDVEITATPPLVNAFGSKAGELFGSNYFVSSIIHDSASDVSCPILPGQSVGTKYSQVVGLTPEQGVVSSVCATNYGVALENASIWVKKSMRDIFIAPDVDASQEEIIDIWISRGGDRVEIRDVVEISGATVKFKSDGVVQPGDRIRYTIHKK